MNESPLDPRDHSRPRVVVAMSGGVDSSVAAALLVQQGYEVIGMMMRLWSESGSGPATPANRCCTPDQMADARRVADRLGIPLYVADVQQHFRQTIVQFFLDEHDAGRTPNPCVECNRQIRFTYLLDRALALNADFLATGHYARVVREDGSYLLKQGKDSHKDQSYVLHTFRQEQLAHVLFPIGEYTKDEVRQLAREHGLPVASKQESQDLCFLNDGDYRRFIRDYSPQDHPPGPILDLNGRELGQHEGLPFYTIGQRKGLGIAAAEPLFVLGKDTTRNALIVGPRAALGVGELVARDVNWIAGRPPAGPIRAEVKIRYMAAPVQSVVTPLDGNQAHVTFSTPVLGVTPGQAAVFYEGDTCLGGGLIRDGVQPNDARGQTAAAEEAANK
ncbi:MAG: tRNA 2-thiouridine(34) synthase MnmA [Candidatus Promineofilum sp.]|nr:tRNA 2-thiouridine(34) synthase MnmA [Promineifilum sp.]